MALFGYLFSHNLAGIPLLRPTRESAREMVPASNAVITQHKFLQDRRMARAVAYFLHLRRVSGSGLE